MFEHLATWVPPLLGEYPHEIEAGSDIVRVRVASQWVNNLDSKDGEKRTRHVVTPSDLREWSPTCEEALQRRQCSGGQGSYFRRLSARPPRTRGLRTKAASAMF